ncbi:MAG: efflux RND transporter periplasmic adaptor subunit [Spirochaetales bacterium]|nr:efflux RND transporter periplasmic adaptor subunit [Spirochaetales bacterium]
MNERSLKPAVFLRYAPLLFWPILFSGCPSPSPETGKEETRTVEVFEVQTVEVQGELEGFGNLSFRSKADITAAVEGTIMKLYRDEGDRVLRGQTLAELGNLQLLIRREQAEASLVSARAALEQAAAEYKEGTLYLESRLLSLEKSVLLVEQKGKELEHQRRVLENKRELYAIGGLPEEEMSSLELSYSSSTTELEALQKDIAMQRIGFRDEDILSFGLSIPADPESRKKVLQDINTRTLLSQVHVAEAGVRSAATELDSVEALIKEMHLKAPMDGIIGARFKEPGERVSADTKVFTIFDASNVDFIIPVPEEIGVYLLPGQSVDVSIDALPQGRYKAAIRQISPLVDSQSGNITVKAALENTEDMFLPGMFARFHLTYGMPRSILIIPVETLAQRNGENALVFQVLNKRIYPKQITIFEHTNGMVEVTGGLAGGETIVLQPSPLLQEGEEVNVR